jgi:hypothetical protein
MEKGGGEMKKNWEPSPQCQKTKPNTQIFGMQVMDH